MMKNRHSGSSKPLGKITRGKTVQNRLRRVDLFLSLYDPGLISRADGEYNDAIFVDLGYGDRPLTTLESAVWLKRHNSELEVVGVEIDPDRVEAAKSFVCDGVSFRQGGFNLPLFPRERVRLIRAFNVLRQYDEVEVREAYQALGANLLEGGLIVEGTSDPFGRIWVANVLRRREDSLVIEAMVFGTNFRWGFSPDLYQPVLPKSHIHHMVPGEPIYQFFNDWKRAYRETLPLSVWGPRQLFIHSARKLVERGYDLVPQMRLLGRGFMIWRPGPKARIPIPG